MPSTGDGFPTTLKNAVFEFMATQVEQGGFAVSRSTAREAHASDAVGGSAPFALRCGALLIDYIAVVGVIAFSTIIARMMGGGTRVIGGTVQITGIIVAAGILVLNFGLVAGLTGQTLGKWATGLRIEREDQADLGFGRAALRHFVGYPLSMITLGLGFLLAVFNARGRTLHDILAGTVVVRERRARRRPIPTP